MFQSSECQYEDDIVFQLNYRPFPSVPKNPRAAAHDVERNNPKREKNNKDTQ